MKTFFVIFCLALTSYAIACDTPSESQSAEAAQAEKAKQEQTKSFQDREPAAARKYQQTSDYKFSGAMR